MRGVVSVFDFPESRTPLTDDQVRERALDAAAKAIRAAIEDKDELTVGRISEEDDEKIRAEMGRIARTVERGGVL